MPARSERRHHRRGSGSTRGAASQAAADDCFLDAPAPLSPRDAAEVKNGVDAEEVEQTPQHGISILKEIFPELEEGENGPGKKPILTQLLGCVPSPARGSLASGSQTSSSVPFGPPAHAPMPLVAPVVPPPPMLPAAACQPRQEQYAPQQVAAAPLPDQGFASYRERLRAGGRGAFQRAYDAGFVPKNMKQEWQTQGALPQHQDMQNSMQYGAAGDAQQMWSGSGQMQSNDYCGVGMQGQYQCMQQMHGEGITALNSKASPYVPEPMQQPQMMVQMLPQMAIQQPAQMMTMPQGDQSPMMHMPTPQLQLPQMAMSHMHTPTASGASTPTGWPLQLASGQSTPTATSSCPEIDSVRNECMAIIMPQTSQLSNDDRLMLAAQLQASADCQRYED